MEHDLAQLLSENRPARLAGGDKLDLLGLQVGLEQLDLGRLAATVETFERDEHVDQPYLVRSAMYAMANSP